MKNTSNQRSSQSKQSLNSQHQKQQETTQSKLTTPRPNSSRSPEKLRDKTNIPAPILKQSGSTSQDTKKNVTIKDQQIEEQSGTCQVQEPRDSPAKEQIYTNIEKKMSQTQASRFNPVRSSQNENSGKQALSRQDSGQQSNKNVKEEEQSETTNKSGIKIKGFYRTNTVTTDTQVFQNNRKTSKTNQPVQPVQNVKSQKEIEHKTEQPQQTTKSLHQLLSFAITEKNTKSKGDSERPASAVAKTFNSGASSPVKKNGNAVEQGRIGDHRVDNDLKAQQTSPVKREVQFAATSGKQRDQKPQQTAKKEQILAESPVKRQEQDNEGKSQVFRSKSPVKFEAQIAKKHKEQGTRIPSPIHKQKEELKTQNPVRKSSEERKSPAPLSGRTTPIKLQNISPARQSGNKLARPQSYVPGKRKSSKEQSPRLSGGEESPRKPAFLSALKDSLKQQLKTQFSENNIHNNDRQGWFQRSKTKDFVEEHKVKTEKIEDDLYEMEWKNMNLSEKTQNYVEWADKLKLMKDYQKKLTKHIMDLQQKIKVYENDIKAQDRKQDLLHGEALQVDNKSQNTIEKNFLLNRDQEVLERHVKEVVENLEYTIEEDDWLTQKIKEERKNIKQVSQAVSKKKVQLIHDTKLRDRRQEELSRACKCMNQMRDKTEYKNTTAKMNVQTLDVLLEESEAIELLVISKKEKRRMIQS